MSRSRKHAALDEFLEWESQSCVDVVADVTTDENASFMPLASLKAYFEANDCQRIDEILCEVFATKYPPVDSEFILREHIAIFCILLRIGQGKLIEHFARYEELSDRRLPFDPNHPPVGFPSPDDDPIFIQRFCEKQRAYCVPIFDAHMLHKHFGNQRLLPITSKASHGDEETSNEFIIQVYGPHNKMLPRGKDTSNANANTFLLKRYPTKDGEPQYTQIINGFRSVRQADSIIKFYGSYIYGESYNILLEFADKGSLEEYFKRESPPSRGVDIIKFWEGLFQLIKGLKAIHSAREGHFDVRPGRVLVVSKGAEVSDWLFKFADFGSSNIKPKDRLSNEIKDAPTYEAPECHIPYSSDDQSSGSSTKITWAADIWSLGCIYSEAAMWIADGYKGVTDYRKQRMADTNRILFKGGDCFHDGERVLQSVIDAHREIEDRLRRSDYITQDVLDSMVEEMLWEEDRPNAKALWRKAEGVMSRAHQRLASNSGDEVSRNSSGKSRTLPPLRSQPPTKPLPIPPRPAPGLSSIAERQYVDNVEKWRSQVTTSVVSSSLPSRPPSTSQLSRAPSDVSSTPLPHTQLHRAGTVTSDLDREINGSIASWQLVDNTSSASPSTTFASPHVSSLYDERLEEPLPPVRHRILRPHQPVENRRPPQAMSHLSNNPRHNGNFGNANVPSPPLESQPPPRNSSRNSTIDGGFVPISAPGTPPLNLPKEETFDTGLFPPSPAPPPQKTDTARIFSQEIKSTFRTEADWDIGAAIVDPRNNLINGKPTSLGRVASQAPSQAPSQAATRAPSRAGSQNSSSIYSGPTGPSVQPDSVSFTTMIQEEQPSLSAKPSKRGFAFSIFPSKSKLRNDSSISLESSRPSTNHDSVPPSHSNSDTASTFSGSHLPSEYGPSIEYLSLNTCLEWKRASKSLSKKNKSTKLPPLPGAHRLKGLSDRDHVFILDDSASMSSVWPDVKRLFEALSYTVKGMSPNGTELFFTISYDTWRRKDTFDLCAYLEKHILNQKIPTDIAKRLNLQLETYRHRFFQEKTDAALKIEKKKREKIAGLPPQPVRPMSFYIFTNGEWKAGSDTALQNIIQAQADWLKAEGLPEGQVTIEFVSFASSALAMGRLNDLAKKDFGRDIVDCTRWTGNVLKMLVGPLDKAFYASVEGGDLEPPKIGDTGSVVSEMAA